MSTQTVEIVYTEQEITISCKLASTGERTSREKWATVAVGTGLAYYYDGDGDYVVMHVPTGLRLCSDVVAESAEEAQRWITNLVQLADWTGGRPRITASELTILKLAVIGSLYVQGSEAKE